MASGSPLLNQRYGNGGGANPIARGEKAVWKVHHFGNGMSVRMDVTKQRRRIVLAQQEAAALEAASLEEEAASFKDPTPSEASSQHREERERERAAWEEEAALAREALNRDRSRKDPLSGWALTASIAKAMMLNNHAHESVRDIMLGSSMFDVPHTPPKKKNSRPKTKYGHGCTIRSAPGSMLEKLNTDVWEDEMTEMGFMSLARKCAVQVDLLKELHKDWEEMTKKKKKGMQLKPFSKIIEKWYPTLDKNDLERFSDDFFYALDRDYDGKLSFGELSFGISITLVSSKKDSLMMMKKQVTGIHAEDAALFHRLLDDNRNGFISLLNFYKFFGETLSGYRYRKRLADALFNTISDLYEDDEDVDPDGHAGISIDTFVNAMVTNHRMWYIFSTCLPLKFIDSNEEDYKESRAELVKTINETRKNDRYAFELDCGAAPVVEL